MSEQDERLRELIAKWDREADGYGNYSMKETKRSCARQLEAVLAAPEPSPVIRNASQRLLDMNTARIDEAQWWTDHSHGDFIVERQQRRELLLIERERIFGDLAQPSPAQQKESKP